MEREINRFNSVEDEFPGLDGFELDPSSSKSTESSKTSIKKYEETSLSYKKTSRLLMRKKTENANLDSSDDEFFKERKNNDQIEKVNEIEEEYSNLRNCDIKCKRNVSDLETRNGNSFSTTCTTISEISRVTVNANFGTNMNKQQINSNSENYHCIQNNINVNDFSSKSQSLNYSNNNEIYNCQSNVISENRYVERRMNSLESSNTNQPVVNPVVLKKKKSIGMLSDLNWSKKVGNNEVLKSMQILYKLIQKHDESNIEKYKKFSR